MILPPSPIIQKTFDFLSKSIQQTFITDNDNEGKLINSFDKEVYINERINRPDVYDKNKNQVAENNKLYKSGSKTPINDPKEHEAFVKRMHQIFDNNPYWSAITTTKYDSKKLNSTLKQHLVPDTVSQKIAKFAQKICKTNPDERGGGNEKFINCLAFTK